MMGTRDEDPRFGAPLFKDIGTFMGVPASRDLSHARAAVVGIPFDCGLHPVRLGARLGPAEIRRQSSLVRRINQSTKVAPFDLCRVGDVGDALIKSPFHL